jgi:endonuclease/exonuclease/phosphatase family metal-dependent hydrolase
MQSARARLLITVACAILFFLFFQSIADFIAAIYAIALLRMSLTVEVATALFLFSPVILLLFRRPPSWRIQVALGATSLLCWILSLFLNTRGKIFASGLGTACFLVFLPSFIANLSGKTGSQLIGLSLGAGSIFSIGVRLAHKGVNLSMAHQLKQGDTAIVYWITILIGFGIYSLAKLVPSYRKSQPASHVDRSDASPTHPLKMIALSLGITASLVLMYFAFANPDVIVRWTGASDALIQGVLLLGFGAFMVGMAWGPALLDRIPRGILLAWNVLFVFCLTLTLLAHQVLFPSTPGGYPIEATTPPWHMIPLVLMLLLAPVILVDFSLYCREIVAMKPSIRLFGGSFAIGSLFMLVMIFAQVFTTVYDYIPVVGPFFRDRYWLVFLVDGVMMGLPGLLLGKKAIDHTKEPADRWFVFYVALFILHITSRIVIDDHYYTQLRTILSNTNDLRAHDLRVLTFNIQQGYSQGGQINIEGQFDLIRSEIPDVVGIQECDTTRVSIGNADVVRYFAKNLNMYAYYGPSTVAGTFGIALISRYPIHNPHTYYLYSLGEQTAIIEAQITISEKTYNVFVTHLGNGGPLIQQEQVLQLVQGKENVLLMGDFNFSPNTYQYRLTTDTLTDAWLQRQIQNGNLSDSYQNDRIDFLFVSPGMEIASSEYIETTASDHPMLITEIVP